MSFKITATAPTSYQLTALRYFNMPITNLGNGVHRAETIFNTEDEAIQFLIGVAEKYYDEYDGQSKMYINEIVTYGFLGIDGVVAHIREIENED